MHDRLTCKCGCGQWAPESHDPATMGRWYCGTDTTCYAGAAVETFMKANPDLPPGAIVTVRLLAPGERLPAEAKFDPSRALEEHEAMLARLAAAEHDG